MVVSLIVSKMNPWGTNEAQKARRASRFYCGNSEACNKAEKALSNAGIRYVKLESEHDDPVLITGHRTCRGLNDILSYTIAFAAIKEKYALDWS